MSHPFLSWPSRSESQPSYPCRHKLTVPEFLLTIPGETKTPGLLLSLVLTWLPSGPPWVSQHWHSSSFMADAACGTWDFFSRPESPAYTLPNVRSPLLCLDFPLVHLDCYWCILTPFNSLCSQNLVIPGISELKPFSLNPDWALFPLLVYCETLFLF